MTYSLDLLFLDGANADYPGPAIAHIYVATSTTHAYPGASSTLPLISPQCMSHTELQAQIDRLKAELDEIGEQAKRKFAAHRKNASQRARPAS